MKDILVIGGGGHAKVVISIIKKTRNYNILGYTDIIDKGRILDIPYFGTDDYLMETQKNVSLALGIGQITNVEIRNKIVQKFKGNGYSFETIISPNAIINEDVNVGIGTVIMDGVVINSGSVIGEYSIINTKSSIDHDCKMGSFVHVAPGVTISGGTKIGTNCTIGAGTTIIQQITIGYNTIIGAGSLVNKNIEDNVIVYGIPCKIKGYISESK